MKSSRLCLAVMGVLALIVLLALANGAKAGEAYCDACSGESGWSGAAKLDEIGNVNQGESKVMSGLSTAQKNRVGIWNKPLAGFEGDASNQENNASNSEKSALEKPAQKQAQAVSKTSEENAVIVRSSESKMMLVSLEDANSSCILLDISENATDHISGSIAIPYTRFLSNNNLKSIEEISQILGEAGISNDDCIIIYGECMPCGGGPAPATLVYWMMKSMDQEKVRVLDGTVKDWAAAGKPTSGEVTVMPPKTYTGEFTPDFMATYDYVKSQTPQIVDARPMQEFGAGSIPGAININYENMISSGRIKDEAKLKRIFATLSKDRPVVVYTNQPTKASVAWFALKLMGYDAMLYSYENWLYNQAGAQASTENATAKG
jgi:thiosulfate/3-mercaptopyruvate sulfurtransferase